MMTTYQQKSWIFNRLANAGDWQRTPEAAQAKNPVPRDNNTNPGKGPSPLWSNNFPFVLTILFDEAAGNAPADLFGATRLILAHDLLLEPSWNPAGNRLNKSFTLDQATGDDGQTTGMQVCATSSTREKILNQLWAWQGSLKGNLGASVLENTSQNNLTLLMNTGIEVTNSYREQSWIYKYFMTDNPQAAILAIRTFLEDNLGIEAGHYTAINTSPDQVLVAVNQDMITKACDAREATLDIIHAIRHGAQRNGQPLTREHCPAFLTERLARGADLRTVDTKGARSGYTLADVMRKYEAYGLLVAFRQLQSLPSDRTIRSYEPTIS